MRNKVMFCRDENEVAKINLLLDDGWVIGDAVPTPSGTLMILEKENN